MNRYVRDTVNTCQLGISMYLLTVMDNAKNVNLQTLGGPYISGFKYYVGDLNILDPLVPH